MTSSASVTAMTSAMPTPGAVSSRVALTVRESDDRHVGDDQIYRPHRR